jgi:hypothetical protein
LTVDVMSLDALDAAYGDLTRLFVSLDEAQSWKSTRCMGWVVRDLILHLLGDAQRGLVALATPANRDPDKDAVTYWVDAPGQTLNRAASEPFAAWPASQASVT